MIVNESGENVLMHFQIKGAKHGVRRFQNPDGSLTPEGRRRYLKDPNVHRDGSSDEEGGVTIAKPKKQLSRKELKAKKKAAEAKAKAKSDAEKKKREEEEQAAKLAKERRKILQDPELLYKHLHDAKYDYSRKEVEDAIEMFKKEDQILETIKKRRPSEQAVNNGKKIADNILMFAKTGADIYEKIVQIQNLIDTGNKNVSLRSPAFKK